MHFQVIKIIHELQLCEGVVDVALTGDEAVAELSVHRRQARDEIIGE